MIQAQISEIKKIIESNSFQPYNLKKESMFDSIPAEELSLFLESFSLFDKILSKLDISKINLNKNEIQKWSLIYLALHNLLHKENNITNDLTKLEIYSTTPIFIQTKDLIDKNDYQKLVYSYFILSSASLKINHSSPHLISEKLILGEFYAFGGIEQSIWGYQLKTDLIFQIAQNILEKTNKDRINLLINKYKNFIPIYL